MIACFVSFLFVGCGSPNLDDPGTLDDIIAEAIDYYKLQDRGKEGEELFYAPNAQTPYTGWSKELYKNGQVFNLTHYKDGEKYGPSVYWSENGQKLSEMIFNHGRGDEYSYRWYSNGHESEKWIFKDGKVVTVTCWKPNGEKCPITNVVDGNGEAVFYYEDGTEKERAEFKNGDYLWD